MKSLCFVTSVYANYVKYLKTIFDIVRPYMTIGQTRSSLSYMTSGLNSPATNYYITVVRLTIKLVLIASITVNFQTNYG